MIGKQRASFFLALTLVPVFLFFWLFFLSPGASARLGLVKMETYIEIDGVNYGLIEVSSLRDLTSNQPKEEAFTKVSLKRDFVTEPSLYLWALKKAQNRTQLTHVSIITQTKDGVKIARYELNNCKPLSWTVETAEGGFHERIELAVPEIAIH